MANLHHVHFVQVDACSNLAKALSIELFAALGSPEFVEPTASRCPSIVTAQKFELKRQKNRLAMNGQQWLSQLRRYGVVSAHHLSFDNANDLIGLLANEVEKCFTSDPVTVASCSLQR